MEAALLADLRDAVGPLMARIQDAGSRTADLGLLPLVNVLRYGSARKVDTDSLSHVLDGLAARACIALPYGVRGVADDTPAALLGQIISADQALRLLQDEAHQAAWFEALATAAASELSHPMLSGRCARILTEHGEWNAERAAQQLSLHCSPGVAPLAAAQWLEGFLQGSGTLLAHSDALWNIVNGWLPSLPPGTFTELLPLLRRMVSTFTAPERRELGERAAHGGGAASGVTPAEAAVDPARAQRWRLVLGQDATGPMSLNVEDAAIDGVLDALYGSPDGSSKGGLGASAPRVARWLGDIREYFPSSVVQVMQKDALERLELREMPCEPEMLAAVEPDVHLVATLLNLNRVMPNKTRATARKVVAQVVEELERKLAAPMRQAVSSSLNRAARKLRPRHQDIDWLRTIIPETRIGFGRRGRSLRDIVLCVDQSGSMASSVVYAGVFAAVLASIKAVSTSVVVFDTSVADLTPLLSDPFDVLFGTQLGGGTDINRALAYCHGLVTRPRETICADHRSV